MPQQPPQSLTPMKSIKKILDTIIGEFTRKPFRGYLPYPVRYHERYLVPPLAFFVGSYMVLYASGIDFWTALSMWEFWVANVPSVGAGVWVMRHIVKHTYRLDASHAWYATWVPRPWGRAWRQLWHGLALPGFVVLIFFAFYFTVRQRPDLFWRYVREDFTFVLLMLAGFNVLLWFYHRLRVDEIIDHWNRTRRRKDGRKEDAGLRPGVEVIAYGERVKDRVALYEPSGKKNKVHAVAFDGKAGEDTRTLIEIEAEVEGPHFFMVHRSLIVNRAIIAGVRQTKDAVHIVLAGPRQGEVVRVANGRREAFLAWWQGREGEESAPR